MEKSVGLILFRDTKHGKSILLLHYRGGHWDFPKGHVEPGETEHQTALRELREETDIADAQLLDGFRDRVQYSFRRGDRTVEKQVIYYLAETAATAVKLSWEHQAYEWLPVQDALDRLTYDNSRDVLRAALKRLGES